MLIKFIEKKLNLSSSYHLKYLLVVVTWFSTFLKDYCMKSSWKGWNLHLTRRRPRSGVVGVAWRLITASSDVRVAHTAINELCKWAHRGSAATPTKWEPTASPASWASRVPFKSEIDYIFSESLNEMLYIWINEFILSIDPFIWGYARVFTVCQTSIMQIRQAGIKWWIIAIIHRPSFSFTESKATNRIDSITRYHQSKESNQRNKLHISNCRLNLIWLFDLNKYEYWIRLAVHSETINVMVFIEIEGLIYEMGGRGGVWGGRRVYS